MRALAVLAILGLFAPAAAQEPEPRFDETIEVSRVVLDARVVDARGRPILGLAPQDFRLKVDGRAVPLESVNWITESTPFADSITLEATPVTHGPLSTGGRLVVLFFQRDLGDRRVTGLVRMKERAAAFVETLAEGDRAAILLFDSHLRLFLDFTDDKRKLQDTLRRRLLHERPKPVEPGPFPSLAAHFDPDAARRAATPESALLVLARALKPLPGTKSVLFFGWGLGRFSAGQVVMEADYEPARRALADARAAVFALDISDADYHTLEVALEKVALDTGGFYVKTHDFPFLAMNLVEAALYGHYVLAFEAPGAKRGTHSLDIDLVGRSGTVLTPNTFVN